MSRLIFVFAILLFLQPGDDYQVIFSSDRDTVDGRWQLYIADADGDNTQRLLESEGSDYGARLSPDGTRLLFTRRDARGFSEVHVLGAGDVDSTALNGGASPAWSPDGEQIAYTSRTEGNLEVYVMGADGSNPQPITDNPARDYAPSWSPDGSRLAFKSTREDEVAIYVINADRTGLRRLGTTDAISHPPSWSPDGTQLLYTRRVEGESAVYVVDLESAETSRLLTLGTTARVPVWSPDGEAVLLALIMDGQPDIYRVDVESGERMRLTDDPAWDWYPTVVSGWDG